MEIEVEPEKEREEERAPAERKIDYQEVVVSEVTRELHVYTQKVDQKTALESMLSRLRQEIAANPPLGGAYTPKKGDLAIAKFSEDDEWYRVKVEKVAGPNVSVFYIDYGNREVINVTRVAAMPAGFGADKPFATENTLAIVCLPKDVSSLIELRKYRREFFTRLITETSDCLGRRQGGRDSGIQEGRPDWKAPAAQY